MSSFKKGLTIHPLQDFPLKFLYVIFNMKIYEEACYIVK